MGERREIVPQGGEFKRGGALHVHERDDAQHRDGRRREDRSKHGEHHTGLKVALFLPR